MMRKENRTVSRFLTGMKRGDYEIFDENDIIY